MKKQLVLLSLFAASICSTHPLTRIQRYSLYAATSAQLRDLVNQALQQPWTSEPKRLLTHLNWSVSLTPIMTNYLLCKGMENGSTRTTRLVSAGGAALQLASGVRLVNETRKNPSPNKIVNSRRMALALVKLSTASILLEHAIRGAKKEEAPEEAPKDPRAEAIREQLKKNKEKPAAE